MPISRDCTIDLMTVMFDEITIIGARIYQHSDIEYRADSNGQMDTRPLISKILPLDEAVTAIDSLRTCGNEGVDRAESALRQDEKSRRRKLMNMPRTYPEGVTCWVDIEEADVKRRRGSTSVLFGWTFLERAEAPLPHCSTRRSGCGRNRSTEFPGRFGARSPAWNTYISVGTSSRQLLDWWQPEAASRSHRRPSTKPPSLHPVWTARDSVSFVAGHGAAGRTGCNIPGAWNFSDLHTVDPDASTAFYTQVFGWKFDDIGFATMIRQPGYGDHLAATSDLESTSANLGTRYRPVSPTPSAGSLRHRSATAALARDLYRRRPRRLGRGRRAARDRVVHYGQRLDAGCADSRSAGRGLLDQPVLAALSLIDNRSITGRTSDLKISDCASTGLVAGACRNPTPVSSATMLRMILRT